MGRAVGWRVGLEGCRGDPPRDKRDAAIGVLASLTPPGMRSALSECMSTLTAMFIMHSSSHAVYGQMLCCHQRQQ